jgi:hypothetical protein
MFDVILDRYENIFINPDYIDVNLKIKKVNKIRSIVGNVQIIRPFDNDFKEEVKSLKKQGNDRRRLSFSFIYSAFSGGEYRYMPYSVQTKPFCDLVSSDTYLYPDIAKGSDLPEQFKCPLTPVR